MLRLANVAKRYDNGYLALKGISLSVDRGEIIGIVGGSGCGKSTLLRLVAGLDRASSGTVELDGSPISGPRDEIGVVFQEPRLMPWLDIEANVAFAIQHRPKAERERLVAAVLRKVKLTGFERSLPRQLSGGQAQRVAIARALVTQPEVLLLDEPFSALDALTRLDLQDHLVEIWSQFDPGQRPTLVLVTHDIEEAVALADRVVVLRGQPGRIHGEYGVDLPRQQRRDHAGFPALRHRLLEALRHAQAAGPEPDHGPGHQESRQWALA